MRIVFFHTDVETFCNDRKASLNEQKTKQMNRMILYFIFYKKQQVESRIKYLRRRDSFDEFHNNFLIDILMLKDHHILFLYHVQ